MPLNDFIVIEAVETSQRNRHLEIIRKDIIQRIVPLVNVSGNHEYDACQIYIDGFEEPIEAYGSLTSFIDELRDIDLNDYDKEIQAEINGDD